jgi:hypothetical protein
MIYFMWLDSSITVRMGTNLIWYHDLFLVSSQILINKPLTIEEKHTSFEKDQRLLQE